RLRTPLSGLLLAAAQGVLESVPRPEFSDDVAVTVVLASEGYPDAATTGRVITGLDAVQDVSVAHAVTAKQGDDFVATGGRVLSVVALAPDFTAARAKAYAALETITLEGGQYRTDIAARVAN